MVTSCPNGLIPANTPFIVTINNIQNSISQKPTGPLIVSVVTAPPTYKVLYSNTVTISNS